MHEQASARARLGDHHLLGSNLQEHSLQAAELLVICELAGAELAGREIAGLLKTSEANVHQIQSRALRKLRGRLEPSSAAR